jgi:thiamine-phosphate pyrophosphorylase
VLRGLYAITPEGLAEPDLLTRIERALAGGARVVQFRDKSADAARRRQRAAALLALCRAAGAPLIVNDDVELAAAIGADGVHLGREDGSVAAARARLGAEALIGVSCYDAWARAREAAAAGADYLAFGAVFASPTKPAAVRAPLELLGRARREFGLPLAAIGGITLARASAVIEAGADMLAVITDLFDAPDVAAQARRYAGLFMETAR